MTDKSRSPLRPPLRTRYLSTQQHSLVDLMREHQFGRVESMSVRAGQPILDRDVKVVRFVRLGGESRATSVPSGNEFELKRPVRNLFDELARLGNGKVVSLEFRHGLPFLIEIMAPIDESKALNPLMAVEGIGMASMMTKASHTGKCR
jgi:hypothetical protein